MPVFPPHLLAAAAQAHTDELIRRADEHRARRTAVTGAPRRTPGWHALRAALRFAELPKTSNNRSVATSLEEM
jgi:hypothetical protein